MASSNSDHLIVLTHGLNGDHRELQYIEEKIVSIGGIVLNSKCNEGNLSKLGIINGAQCIADEIIRFSENHKFRRISLVGMSLGGLYMRCVAKLLFNSDENTIAGLTPEVFCAFASPFLGTQRFRLTLLNFFFSNSNSN